MVGIGEDQRPAQAIDLVGEHAVDLAGLDIGQQASQGGPVQGGAAVAAVVVALGQEGPALLLLAGDVGFGRGPLSVEGVELLVEAFVGGFAGIDGTADGG